MITLNENTITVDVKAAMIEGSKITNNLIQEKAMKHSVDNAGSIYDLMRFNGTVEYVNKPKEILVSEAPDNMKMSEFHEANKLASEADKFIVDLRFATSFIIDDESIRTVVKREYPELTDKEFAITMSRARNIWRVDYEWAQNVAELIEFSAELKAANK